MRFLENIQQPYGELTSAAELFRKQSSFYEKPQFSRRLVKRLRWAPLFFVTAQPCSSEGRMLFLAGTKPSYLYKTVSAS